MKYFLQVHGITDIQRENVTMREWIQGEEDFAIPNSAFQGKKKVQRFLE